MTIERVRLSLIFPAWKGDVSQMSVARDDDSERFNPPSTLQVKGIFNLPVVVCQRAGWWRRVRAGSPQSVSNPGEQRRRMTGLPTNGGAAENTKTLPATPAAPHTQGCHPELNSPWSLVLSSQ